VRVAAPNGAAEKRTGPSGDVHLMWPKLRRCFDYAEVELPDATPELFTRYRTDFFPRRQFEHGLRRRSDSLPTRSGEEYQGRGDEPARKPICNILVFSTMPNNETCSECRLVRDELAKAINAHIKILGDMQFAAMEYNTSRLKELEPLVLAASNRREVARRAYHDHAATHPEDETL
jgi:hypothetical protein